jgi:hypothetical protein
MLVTCCLGDAHPLVQRYLVWCALLVMRDGGTKLRLMANSEGTELRCWMPEGEFEMIPPPGWVIDELVQELLLPDHRVAGADQRWGSEGIFQVVLHDSVLSIPYRGAVDPRLVVLDFDLPASTDQGSEAREIFQGFRRFATEAAEEGSDAELIRDITEQLTDALAK